MIEVDRQFAGDDDAHPESADGASTADLSNHGAHEASYGDADSGGVRLFGACGPLPAMGRVVLGRDLVRLKAMLPRRFKGAVRGVWANLRMAWWWFVYRLAILANVNPHVTAAIAPRPKPLPVVWVRRSAVVRTFHSPNRLRRERWGLPEGWWNQVTVVARTSVFEPATVGETYEIIHETVRELFLQRLPFRSTQQYHAMIRAVAAGASRWSYGCSSPEEVDAYFERLVGAYRSMATEGFRTQRELGGLDRDEIPLYVANDGILCQGSAGNHRIRIAEILGIEWVPVRVEGLHIGHLRWICREYGLPAHRAVEAWMAAEDRFSLSTPQPAVVHSDDSVVADR